MLRRTSRAVLGVVLGLTALAACREGAPEVTAPSATATTVEVSSSTFDDGGTLPERFTCDGKGLAPPLTWRGPADGVRAWALVVDDPDAPGQTFVHWVVADIPLQVTAMDGSAPDGAVEAESSAHDAGWTPPCPPSGTHHYRFTVYALSAATGLEPGAPTDEALDAIGRVAVDQGVLVGTYGRD